MHATATDPRIATPLVPRRVTIETVVEWMAEGLSMEEVLERLPNLERERLISALKSYFALSHRPRR